MIDYHDLRQVF